MKKVSVHGVGRTSPPAFGEGMLAVVAIAFAAIGAALVRREGIFVRGRSSRHIAVHIPHLAVGFFVGALKIGPQLRIASFGMATDDFMEGFFQIRTRFALGRIIIAGRRLSPYKPGG